MCRRIHQRRCPRLSEKPPKAQRVGLRPHRVYRRSDGPYARFPRGEDDLPLLRQPWDSCNAELVVSACHEEWASCTLPHSCSVHVSLQLMHVYEVRPRKHKRSVGPNFRCAAIRSVVGRREKLRKKLLTPRAEFCYTAIVDRNRK
jgi:hypothetical protein